MKWYSNDISEAVQRSKDVNAIFVVFVEGKDESSQKLLNLINEPKILSKLETDDFVSVKIESESQSYMQFASIYKVVPIPSIFFIGKLGTPLEVVTSIVASVDELDQKITKVLFASGKSVKDPTPVEPTPKVEDQIAGTSHETVKTEDTEIVCDGDVCYRKPKESSTEATAPPLEEMESEEGATAKEEVVEEPAKKTSTAEEQATNAQAEVNARLEETRKLLEQKRRERIEQEKQLEKEREMRRRREGKEMQNLQQWQKEQELKELKENLRRERMEEQAARDRVRAQIAADRAERAKKSAAEANVSTNANVAAAAATDNANVEAPQAPTSDVTRLQFRLSNGTAKTQTFNSQDTLSVVRNYVKTELLPGTGIRDYILSTTYPKRELSVEQDAQTLVELNLFPSAVILVIGKESSKNPAAIIARSGGMINIVSTLFWTLLSPVFAVFGYLRNMISNRGNGHENTGAQKRANEERGQQSEAAKRRNLDRFLSGGNGGNGGGANTSNSQDEAAPNSFGDNSNTQKPYRRYGSSNVHRLTDNRKDSDDENATWNGNSTQQQ